MFLYNTNCKYIQADITKLKQQNKTRINIDNEIKIFIKIQSAFKKPNKIKLRKEKKTF